MDRMHDVNRRLRGHRVMNEMIFRWSHRSRKRFRRGYGAARADVGLALEVIVKRMLLLLEMKGMRSQRGRGTVMRRGCHGRLLLLLLLFMLIM